MTSTVPVEKRAADEAAAIEQVQTTDGDIHRPLAGGPESHPEEAGLLLTPAFSRMRTDWNSADWQVVDSMHKAVNQMIQDRFGDMMEIIINTYDLVREKEIDPRTNLPKLDRDGMPVYRTSPTGAPIEDWTKLTIREQENLIYSISAGLFRWTQIAERLRAEALIGKAQFEEAYSHGYREIKDPKATIDDRTAQGRIRAAEYRYRSVYLAYLSRSADAAVSAIELLGQRVKDVRTSL